MSPFKCLLTWWLDTGNVISRPDTRARQQTRHELSDNYTRTGILTGHSDAGGMSWNVSDCVWTLFTGSKCGSCWPDLLSCPTPRPAPGHSVSLSRPLTSGWWSGWTWSLWSPDPQRGDRAERRPAILSHHLLMIMMMITCLLSRSVRVTSCWLMLVSARFLISMSVASIPRRSRSLIIPIFSVATWSSYRESIDILDEYNLVLLQQPLVVPVHHVSVGHHKVPEGLNPLVHLPIQLPAQLSHLRSKPRQFFGHRVVHIFVGATFILVFEET